jgi:hypothetical protein
MNEEALFCDGFDDAIIGYAERFGMPPVVLYDKDMCIKILMDDGCNEEEAIEYMEYNVLGSFMGNDGTPVFATLI